MNITDMARELLKRDGISEDVRTTARKVVEAVTVAEMPRNACHILHGALFPVRVRAQAL